MPIPAVLNWLLITLFTLCSFRQWRCAVQRWPHNQSESLQIENNRAALNGGAVFVEAGTVANATQCAFNSNTAQQSGGGFFTVGDGSELSITDTTFQNSYASCCYPTGYGFKLQSNLNATLACADVDSDAVADGKNCCYAGQYIYGDQCLPCLRGADCSISGASLDQLPLLPGYWRPSNRTTDIRPCPLPAACAGNNGVSGTVNGVSSGNFQTDTMYCAPGYRGPCKFFNLLN
jgi:hypothetical protein